VVKSGVCEGFLGKVGLRGVIRGNLGFGSGYKGKFRVWRQFEGETWGFKRGLGQFEGEILSLESV